MRFIFGKLVQKLYKKWFPRTDFYIPEKEVTEDQKKNLKNASIELLKNEDLIFLRNIWLAKSENDQLEASNLLKITTWAELESYQRKGVESFFDLIKRYSELSFDEDEKFDRHAIID